MKKIHFFGFIIVFVFSIKSYALDSLSIHPNSYTYQAYNPNSDKGNFKILKLFGGGIYYELNSNDISSEFNTPVLNDFNAYTIDQLGVVTLKTPLGSITKSWSMNEVIYNNKKQNYNYWMYESYDILRLVNVFENLKPIDYFVLYGPTRFKHSKLVANNYKLSIDRLELFMNLFVLEKYSENFEMPENNTAQYFLNNCSTKSIKINLDYGLFLDHLQRFYRYRKDDSYSWVEEYDWIKFLPALNFQAYLSNYNAEYTEISTGTIKKVKLRGLSWNSGISLYFNQRFFNDHLMMKFIYAWAFTDESKYSFVGEAPIELTPNHSEYLERSFNNSYLQIQISFQF